MFDRYNRNINYLRISVTDRCNLRCQYCIPATGVELMNHDEILSFETIVEVVKEAIQKGINKVRLTGGEPLVRKGIVDLVKMIAEIEGVEDLTMTTNGKLLEKFAFRLKEAGLRRINISLDTLDPERYTNLTRGGLLADVLKGIRAAQAAGFDPIKINCVIMKSADEPDAVNVKQFAENNGLKIRFIHQMDLSTGEFSLVEGGDGGDCKNCNRVRLTANGGFKPCLFNDQVYSITDFGISDALEKAVLGKPRSGTRNLSGKFFNIGG